MLSGPSEESEVPQQFFTGHNYAHDSKVKAFEAKRLAKKAHSHERAQLEESTPADSGDQFTAAGSENSSQSQQHSNSHRVTLNETHEEQGNRPSAVNRQTRVSL